MNRGTFGYNSPPNISSRSAPTVWTRSQVWINAGTYSFVVPQNVYQILAACIGSGGSGAAAQYVTITPSANGGAGGGFASGIIDVVPGQVISNIIVSNYTTPATTGAVNANAAVAGTAGGTSSVGIYMSATGGGGGTITNTPATGGTGSISPSLRNAVTYSGGSGGGGFGGGSSSYNATGGGACGSYFGNGGNGGLILITTSASNATGGGALAGGNAGYFLNNTSSSPGASFAVDGFTGTSTQPLGTGGFNSSGIFGGSAAGQFNSPGLPPSMYDYLFNRTIYNSGATLSNALSIGCGGNSVFGTVNVNIAGVGGGGGAIYSTDQSNGVASAPDAANFGGGGATVVVASAGGVNPTGGSCLGSGGGGGGALALNGSRVGNCTSTGGYGGCGLVAFFWTEGF